MVCVAPGSLRGDVRVKLRVSEGNVRRLFLPVASRPETLGGRSEPLPFFCSAEGDMGMSKKVLLIDDDEGLVEMLASALSDAGYRVESAGSGSDGLRRLLDWGPDLVILDVMMPGLDGWETCRRIRAICDVPVLMLTGVEGFPAELKGLGEGADLYMTKPFEIPILLARMRALLRRGRGPLGPPILGPVNIGGLEIHLTEYRAAMNGRPLELSPTEFRLLAALAATPGHVISSQELIREVWDDDVEGDQEQYLKLYIHYLRRKIETDPSNPRYIRTRRGVGYFLATPEGADARSR